MSLPGTFEASQLMAPMGSDNDSGRSFALPGPGNLSRSRFRREAIRWWRGRPPGVVYIAVGKHRRWTISRARVSSPLNMPDPLDSMGVGPNGRVTFLMTGRLAVSVGQRNGLRTWTTLRAPTGHVTMGRQGAALDVERDPKGGITAGMLGPSGTSWGAARHLPIGPGVASMNAAVAPLGQAFVAWLTPDGMLSVSETAAPGGAWTSAVTVGSVENHRPPVCLPPTTEQPWSSLSKT